MVCILELKCLKQAPSSGWSKWALNIESSIKEENDGKNVVSRVS